jgi:small-conductance mechanosensitive channel
VDFDTLARFLLILESAVVLAGAIWLRRSLRLGAVPWTAAPLWTRMLSAWLHFSLFASAVTLAGSIAGFTTAADMLGRAVVSGTFAGSILFAAVRVAEGIAESSAFTGQLRRIRVIHHDPGAFLRVVERAGRTLAFATWCDRLLDYLSIQGPVYGFVGVSLSQPIGYGAVQVTLGGLLAFALALWVSWLLSRFVSQVLEQEIFSRVGKMPRGVDLAVSTISRYAVLVLGFVTAIAALGVEVGNLALLVSALGVGIGFGMQNVVNNFISGLILLFERPIKVGDRISIESLLGEVTSIGIRASTIRTFDGADVLVPNGDLISNQVTNWTLSDARRRVTLPIGIAYGTPAVKVISLLLEIARRNPDVLQDPEPVAIFTGFGDSALDFELRIWTESGDALTLVRSALGVAVQDALAQAGIEIPLPQRDLHLKTVPGAQTAPEGAQ